MKEKPQISPTVHIKQIDLRKLVTARLNIDASTFSRWVREGKLPKPAIALSNQSRYWRRSDIKAWAIEKGVQL